MPSGLKSSAMVYKCRHWGRCPSHASRRVISVKEFCFAPGTASSRLTCSPVLPWRSTQRDGTGDPCRGIRRAHGPVARRDRVAKVQSIKPVSARRACAPQQVCGLRRVNIFAIRFQNGEKSYPESYMFPYHESGSSPFSRGEPVRRRKRRTRGCYRAAGRLISGHRPQLFFSPVEGFPKG